MGFRRRRLSGGHPSPARDEFPAARGAAADADTRGEAQQDGDQEERPHAVSLNGFARPSSLQQSDRLEMSPAPPSLQGHLLLDGGKLDGSAFFRSVVLVCQHDPKGAFGLVLTQPSDRRLEDVLTVDLPPHLAGLKVLHGGPVQPTAFSFLHFHPKTPTGNVLDHLTLGHEPEALGAVASTWSEEQRLLVFAGYAGWSPGQLDEEIRRDSWLHQPVTTGMFAHLEPSTLWRHLLRQRQDWQCRLLAESPEDLTWN